MPVAFKDYYAVLGIPRTASETEIKSAFRAKAREVHPDTHPDDPTAKEKFQEVNEAYEVLSDASKRRMYDRFGEDWQRYRDAGIDPDDVRTSTGPRQYTRPTHQSDEDFERWFTGGDAPSGSWEWSEGGGFRDGGGRFSDFFNLLFGNDEREDRRGARPGRPTRGDDLEVHADVTLRETLHGTRRKMTLQTPETCPTCGGTGIIRGGTCPTCNGTGQISKTKTLEVKIPMGVKTGSRVRIAGQGGPGMNGGPSGDVYLMINVLPDPLYRLEGRNIRMDAKVPLYTAILGGEKVLETLTGKVALTIPAGTENGRVFRLRGKGLPASGKQPAGDLLVTIQIELPQNLSDTEKAKFAELRDMRQ
ncbi:MAG: DnaJ domain-containing protein [Thermomicrobiales bacterium]|nr:DnaJ domain-containing protein [Thermomicrobiales bacterium]